MSRRARRGVAVKLGWGDDTAAKLRMSTQLDRSDVAREFVRSILHNRLNPSARDHLNRALDHIAEAWLAENGQSARTVDAVAVSGANLDRLSRLAVPGS